MYFLGHGEYMKQLCVIRVPAGVRAKNYLHKMDFKGIFLVCIFSETL